MKKSGTGKHIPESEYITKMKNPDNVVEFDNVHTYFFTDIGTVKAVDGVSFEVPQGKTVGIVGESGCGKSVTSLSLMQLVQRPQGQTVEGEIRFNTGDKVYNIVNTPIYCDAEAARQRNVYDLPGADDLLKSGIPDRGTGG